MKSSKEKRQRKFFDVLASPSRKFWARVPVFSRITSRWFGSENVLDLRRAFHRRPEVRAAALLAALAVIFFSYQRIFTRAEVADFFPTTCLGTWQNPDQAQGAPQAFTAEGASGALNASNSAVYAGDDGEIFCGGFVPGNYEPQGKLIGVGLTLAIRVGETAFSPPGRPSSSVDAILPDGKPPETFPSVASSSIEQDSAARSAASSANPAVPTTIEKEKFSDVPEDAPGVPNAASSSIENATTSAGPLLRRFAAALFKLVFAEETTSTPPPHSPPAPEQPTETMPSPSAPDGGGSTTPPFSEAGASSAGMTEPSSTEESLGPTKMIPPIAAPLHPVSPSEEKSPVSSTTEEILLASSTERSDASGTLGPVVIPPPPPDEHFLEVSYSLDGKTWNPVERISPDNWPNFTVALPLTSWEDLKKVQVSIKAVPTTLISPPRTYLDGMLLEARYELPPVISDKATSTPAAAGPKELITFDPRSKHACSVEPFSQSVQPGGSAVYRIILKPSAPIAGYELVLGDLPAGVSAAFGKANGFAASEEQLAINVASGTEAASYNIVVVYRERSENGEFLPNFCKLNLIIQ